MAEWFTSDTHFSHDNIIGFCNRPWKTAADMNDGMVEKWNARVKSDDTVYHLGDFSFKGTNEWNAILDRLNGKIVLVLGNHDIKRIAKQKELRNRFEAIRNDTIVAVPDKHGKFWNVWLNHFPPYQSSDDQRGLWRPGMAPGWYEISLCGHVHTEWKHYNDTINIGADMWDYQPVSIDEILEYRESFAIID